MSTKRLQLGDVFTIPLDEARVGFGQVVAKYHDEGYYFAIFDHAYGRSALPAIHDVVSGPIAFLALSFDGKVYAGQWQVIGSAPVRKDLPLPAYKESVGTPDQIDVVDYSGQRRRRAAARELDVLPNRKFVAPVRLEKALRARHGLEPWSERYDDLRPNDAATTSRFFPLS